MKFINGVTNTLLCITVVALLLVIIIKLIRSTLFAAVAFISDIISQDWGVFGLLLLALALELGVLLIITKKNNI